MQRHNKLKKVLGHFSLLTLLSNKQIHKHNSTLFFFILYVPSIQIIRNIFIGLYLGVCLPCSDVK